MYFDKQTKMYPVMSTLRNTMKIDKNEVKHN